MATKRLGQKNIDLLLDQYRGERKRLIFQLDKIRSTISELKAVRSKEVPKSAADGIKRPVGRPRKNTLTPATAAKKSGRRRRRVKNGGYRLSPWDDMVIAAIGKGRMLTKQEILDQARVWAKKNEPKMKQADVEVKVTRVLQKLSGTRGLLGTHRTGLQRGYHYGLKEWFFASSGALRKQHLNRLVIKK